MSSVCLLAEQSGGKLNPITLEVLSAAQTLAGAAGLPVRALVLCGADETQAADALAGYALDKVIRVAHARLAPYVAESHLAAALAALAACGSDPLVLLPHTYQTRDYAPRLAARRGQGLITDVTALRWRESRLECSRPVYGGKLAAEVYLRAGPAGFYSLQAGAFPQPPAPAARPVPIEDFAVEIPAPRVLAEAPFQEARQSVDLSQAAAIVAAGRGIKEAKNLEMIRQLAAQLGAEVAASRPLCDSGWLPMYCQIGSSGQTVAPRLYVAIGISGAIQHLVGMKGARTIVAINKDPEAPIFEVADYGLAGDLFAIVPALISALNAA